MEDDNEGNSLDQGQRPTVGVVMRFYNGEETIPHVLDALKRQTRQVDKLVGVDSGGTDSSADLLRGFGGEIVYWKQPYQYGLTTNFGIYHCKTDYVLILSHHTVLNDEDAVERMCAELDNPEVACVGVKWGWDDGYSDDITLEEMKSKGIGFGAIFTHSAGMLKRRLWEANPVGGPWLFAKPGTIQAQGGVYGSDDYAWALNHLYLGYHCRRLDIHVRYLRQTQKPEFFISMEVFALADALGVHVVGWSAVYSLKVCLCIALQYLLVGKERRRELKIDFQRHFARLAARVSWRFWQRKRFGNPFPILR